MNKKRLKRLICNLIGHNYLFKYNSYSTRYNEVAEVYKCKRCKKIIKKLNRNKTKNETSNFNYWN